MTRALDFQAARDDGGDSWDRPDVSDDRTNDNSVIARLKHDQWAISLPDGDSGHVVTLRREGRGYVGECDCGGYKFHSGPCAHLVALRKAEFIGRDDDVTRDPIAIPDEVDRYDHEIEQSVATDGGERR